MDLWERRKVLFRVPTHKIRKKIFSLTKMHVKHIKCFQKSCFFVVGQVKYLF